MKVRSARANNRKKAFEIKTSTRSFVFPYSKVSPKPSAAHPVVGITVDKELAREAFTYFLKSGRQGLIHIEQVLDYNDVPSYMRDALLYRLTLEAQKRGTVRAPRDVATLVTCSLTSKTPRMIASTAEPLLETRQSRSC